MTDTYYAASYWLARAETVEACARRAEHFFHLLGHCDPAWARWYEKANSFEAARKLQFSTDATSFRELFAREENHFDDDFSFHLWTGNSPEETSVVDGACGSSSLLLPSRCVLRPYDEGLIGEQVLTAPVMTEVSRAMALAWEPEWGVATSREHRDSVTESADLGTFVGWVMYFSRLRGTVPPLPAPVRIEPVEDKGTLVVLTPERFTASNPEHVALAARVHELLARAGLLRPLQPWPAG
ncbi:immunity 52 family protein [Hyalangium versicolor]|uniref:immunity 52 family protein n=1 Tax=Hyalangium versicolor TaxID=2861190 RepID=UPI00359F373B